MMKQHDYRPRSLSLLLLAAAFVLPPPWELHRPSNGGVLGQQVYDDTYCNTFNDIPLLMLDRLDACDSVVSPQCQCGTQEEDYDTYASCWDENVQCSALNPSVCGRQSAMTLVLGQKNVYVWEYTSGRSEKLTWTYDGKSNSCSFEIEASSGSKTFCTCELTDCNRAGPKNYVRIDCSNYQSGAVSDDCYDGLGIATGSVLEGLAVTAGGRCVGGSVPIPAPGPSGSAPTGSVPAPAPTGSVPVPSGPLPAPTFPQPVQNPSNPSPGTSAAAAIVFGGGGRGGIAGSIAAVAMATTLAVGGAMGW